MVASMDQSAALASRPLANRRPAILVVCATALCVIICSYHQLDARSSEALSPAKAATLGDIAKKARGKGFDKLWCKAIEKDGFVEKVFQRIHSQAALDELIDDIKKLKNVDTFKKTAEKWISKRGTAKESEGDWAKIVKDSGNTEWTQTALAHTMSCWKVEDMKDRFTCGIQKLETNLIAGVTPEEKIRRTVSVIRLLAEAKCNQQNAGPFDVKMIGFTVYIIRSICAVANPNSNLNHFVEFIERSNVQAKAIAGVKAEEEAKEKNIVYEWVQDLHRKWRKEEADLKADLEDKVFAALKDDMKNCRGKPFKNYVACMSEKISSHVFKSENAKKFAVKAAVGFCEYDGLTGSDLK